MTEQEMWEAVIQNDSSYDGVFFYALLPAWTLPRQAAFRQAGPDRQLTIRAFVIACSEFCRTSAVCPAQTAAPPA